MITDDLPLFAPYADKLQTGWLLCKEKHPQLLRKCYELCITAKRRGIERWSADAMFHVLRWETGGDYRRPGTEDQQQLFGVGSA